MSIEPCANQACDSFVTELFVVHQSPEKVAESVIPVVTQPDDGRDERDDCQGQPKRRKSMRNVNVGCL
jgi:hypothetical protein